MTVSDSPARPVYSVTRWSILVGVFVLALPAGFGQVLLVVLLTGTLGLLLWALAPRRTRTSFSDLFDSDRLSRAVVIFCGILAAAIDLAYLLERVPQVVAVLLAVAVAVAVVAVAVVPAQQVRLAVGTAVSLQVGTLLVGVLVGPHVVIDVASLIDGATHDLLHGRSPYGGTTPNPYDAKDSLRFLAPDLVDGDQILIGYPYLPGSLLAEVPGALIGSILVAHVLALAGLAGVWWKLAVDDAGRRLAVLAVASPITLAVVVNFWVEPVMMLAVGVVSWSLRRRWRAGAAMAVAYLMLSKQYLVVCLPVLLVLQRRFGTRVAAMSVAGVVVVMGLFLAWDPEGFVHDVLQVHLLQPFREDSVSLVVVLSNALGRPPGWVLASVPLVAGLGIASWVSGRRAPTATTAALAIGLATWVTVLLSKQGHANYYAFVQAAMICAFLTWPADEPTEPLATSEAAAEDAAWTSLPPRT